MAASANASTAPTRAVKAKMIDDRLISSQQTVKFVLPGGEVPSNRAKVVKKRARE